MKLIFNIDKDDLLAVFTLMMTTDAEAKGKVREWLEAHDEMEIQKDLLGEEGSRELMVALGAVALAGIWQEIEGKK